MTYADDIQLSRHVDPADPGSLASRKDDLKMSLDVSIEDKIKTFLSAVKVIYFYYIV